MGGMNTWLWGERYRDYMDALVPNGLSTDSHGESQLDAAADDA
jgi:hypothetical protein